jgi:hypothetical protein
MSTDYTRATHIAISRNHYGRGHSPEEAKRNLKRQGGSLREYLVYALPAGAINSAVDDFGSIRWEWAEGFEGERGQGEVVEERGL